jgi:hypothetical protein
MLPPFVSDTRDDEVARMDDLLTRFQRARARTLWLLIQCARAHRRSLPEPNDEPLPMSPAQVKRLNRWYGRGERGQARLYRLLDEVRTRHD